MPFVVLVGINFNPISQIGLYLTITQDHSLPSPSSNSLAKAACYALMESHLVCKLQQNKAPVE